MMLEVEEGPKLITAGTGVNGLIIYQNYTTYYNTTFQDSFRHAAQARTCIQCILQIKVVDHLLQRLWWNVSL